MHKAICQNYKGSDTTRADAVLLGDKSLLQILAELVELKLGKSHIQVEQTFKQGLLEGRLNKVREVIGQAMQLVYAVFDRDLDLVVKELGGYKGQSFTKAKTNKVNKSVYYKKDNKPLGVNMTSGGEMSSSNSRNIKLLMKDQSKTVNQKSYSMCCTSLNSINASNQ